MSSFNTISIIILATAFVSLGFGLALFWSSRKATPGSSPRTTNRIAWLLIALFPVLILFSFFPGNTFSGTLLGFSATGATALFIFIGGTEPECLGSDCGGPASVGDKPGTRSARSHHQLNGEIRGLQINLEQCKTLTTATQGPQVLTETQISGTRCSPRARNPSASSREIYKASRMPTFGLTRRTTTCRCLAGMRRPSQA